MTDIPFSWLDLTLLVLALPALAASGYLAFLTVLSKQRPAPTGAARTRFDIVVPAHNEANGIAATVASLSALEYPAERRRILVVADNCTDDTASRAADAGAIVLVRHHATERGKGYALAHAYAQSLGDGFADAIVVVDADSSVSPNLLSAFAARFEGGALALQAEYGVRNANESWRTRLMVIALTMFHTVRSLGRERLHLSCGLRGNGMAFSADLVRRVPQRAFSLVEDVEYGIALGLQGIRVEYVHEASVLGDMPTTASAAQTQRERWEGGRIAMLRAHLPPLLGAARRTRSAVPVDLALDLLVPPLTTLGAMIVVGLGLSTLAVTQSDSGRYGLLAWCTCAAFIALYLIRGIILSGTGFRAIRDLLWLPVFVLWKLTASLRPRGRSGEWVRTPRADER
ncbi:MAG: glycosyltransferase family 2 protein [Gemmatimonadaceae bacterium]|nr:glycosyltransferase family 2 protein [Gemmatimonadaceae bacterium]